MEHVEECSNCGSSQVFEDLGARTTTERSWLASTVRCWYDCLGCGARLMKKFEGEQATSMSQAEDVGRGVATRETHPLEAEN